ncbi:uncharacterized protein STEHIDRAFT_72967 [Stereum hirsutum FP-91666 SS1]|uniref:uncharacterized protein n=1 Tax=Stereum hirsutum (strain FP-91666) TaxID=721885 RepID=UPI000440B0FA|nr:uncharacterized protein STEHIDRAFT_72967 [Stereum hirsutum FP-91666 SS1]EIM91195.1 hypothetical protein STEHIDRAFT_72967 [Stereum hirsutum FP-91666 SS1]
MILDGFGLPGQLKLQRSSVVVVGAGGLGCPALQYLAAAGVGKIGIVDHDTVELSNLQRQILHTESRLGQPKAQSAAQALKEINSRIQIDVHIEAVSPSNATSILEPYDIILDCTDNAPTRYLLSDTAVKLDKPLVSGAAQKFEGQLCVYHLGEDGPCYRCLFPRPPAQETVGTCEETGILGAVTGVIGNLQALEAIKIITGMHEGKPGLLIYSSLGTPPFRSIKLRTRRPTCPACGIEDQKVGSINEGMDYVQFCGGERPDWVSRGLLDGLQETRIRATELKRVLSGEDSAPSGKVQIIDVRPRTEFGICALPGSIHVPLTDVVAYPSKYIQSSPFSQTFVVCRLGNDSQIAAEALRSVDSGNTTVPHVVKDLVGGLRAWSKEVDPEFPMY